MLLLCHTGLPLGQEKSGNQENSEKILKMTKSANLMKFEISQILSV